MTYMNKNLLQKTTNIRLTTHVMQLFCVHCELIIIIIIIIIIN